MKILFIILSIIYFNGCSSIGIKKNSLISNSTVISYEDAHKYVGYVMTVEGVIRDVYNNRKVVYLWFMKPHNGKFLVRIMKEHWENFPAPPEVLYRVGQKVQITGLLKWYQGSPVIYVQKPSQIK